MARSQNKVYTCLPTVCPATIGLLKAVLLVDGAGESNVIEGDITEEEFTLDVADVVGYSNCGALKVSLDLRRKDMGLLAP